MFYKTFLSLCYGNNHSIIPLVLAPTLPLLSNLNSSIAFVMKNSVLTSHWYDFTVLSTDRCYKKWRREEVDLTAGKMQCGNRPSSNLTTKVQTNGWTGESAKKPNKMALYARYLQYQKYSLFLFFHYFCFSGAMSLAYSSFSVPWLFCPLVILPKDLKFKTANSNHHPFQIKIIFTRHRVILKSTTCM